jgi:hypothetical protein
MASHGSRFKRLSVDAVAEILADIESELSDFTANCVKSPCTQEILADIESELSDFTANCVKSPCTQENALRTFIQRGLCMN